jgi:hypothetical protein
MFNSLEQGSTFGQRLLRAQTDAAGVDTSTTDLQQWLEYWNDTESVTTNLRKVEHWLQRARSQQN